MNRQQRRAAARQAQISGPVRLEGADKELRDAQAGQLSRARAPYLTDLFRRGVVDHQAGRLQQAEAAYRQVLAVEPGHADALHFLGVIAHQVGRNDLAIDYIRRAIGLHGVRPNAHNNLGNALYALGRLAEAEASYRGALRLKPDHPEAHNNLGNVLRHLGRLTEAEASYQEALRLRPDYPEAHNNLGNVLRDLGRLAEAEAAHREARRIRPDYSEAHNNLGNVLRDLGRLAEAEASYREALRLRPDFPDAHYNLSSALLLAGRLEEGWKEYEWRWKTKQARGARHFSAPLWSGEAIGDRVILLHAEQGLGDTLQFCRYVPLIAAGARTVLDVQAPLVGLLSQLPGIIAIVARGDRLPFFDLHCPLLSLPRAFGTTLDTIPAATPYLTADPALAAHWRERLAGMEGLRVGLVWASNPDPREDASGQRDRRSRSMTLDHLAPLARVTGASFVSLQKGDAAAQTRTPPAGLVIHDWTDEIEDFADTAALIEALDFVISIDTAVAHLAGALGKPVWLLNRFDSEWRWLLNRDDSPWYPTLRQFRQLAPGDWNSVITNVRDALRCLAAGDRDQLRPLQAKM